MELFNPFGTSRGLFHLSILFFFFFFAFFMIYYKHFVLVFPDILGYKCLVIAIF